MELHTAEHGFSSVEVHTCAYIALYCFFSFAGTAKPGKHYEDISGTLEFKKGDIKKSIEVPVTQRGTVRTTTRLSIPSVQNSCQQTLVQIP